MTPREEVLQTHPTAYSQKDSDGYWWVLVPGIEVALNAPSLEVRTPVQAWRAAAAAVRDANVADGDAEDATPEPLSRAERVISFIEQYCRVPEGPLLGQLIVLDDFQKDFIRRVYDNPHGTTTAHLSMARKNGKTALIACLLLAHLVVDGVAVKNSQIVSGAMSREQASIVFNLAVKIVNLSEDLKAIIHIVPSSKRLIGKPLNVEYKALAAEGRTTHGLSPILAILDEIGQVRGPRSDFVDAIVTAQGAYDDALLIAISTQAANDADLFSVWLDDAATSEDPSIVSVVYEAPADCDLTDPEAWKAANPALGNFRSLRDMESLSLKASRMPSMENMFRNLNLNQRVSTVSPFISRNAWEACSNDPDLSSCVEFYGGLDLSARTDLTALVIIGKDTAGVWHVRPFFWTPEVGLLDRAKKDRVPYDLWAREGLLQTTPGATVDYSFVATDMADLIDVDLESLAYDRWRMDILQKELDGIGLSLPLVPHGQGYKDMTPALDMLEAEILNGRLHHGGHPVLTMCAANAVVNKDPSGNRKLDKAKATGRIDGMVALTMAFGATLKGTTEETKNYSLHWL